MRFMKVSNTLLGNQKLQFFIFSYFNQYFTMHFKVLEINYLKSQISKINIIFISWQDSFSGLNILLNDLFYANFRLNGHCLCYIKNRQFYT